MNSRHRSREIALQILYQLDLTSGGISMPPTKIVTTGPVPKADPVAAPISEPAPALTMQAVAAALHDYYDHFTVPQEIREFVGKLVAGTLAELPKIDELLQTHASNWRIARMSSLDRSLLRMAAYELTQSPEVPKNVVIDEAIELAKQFGTAETPSFVNGVLDSIPR